MENFQSMMVERYGFALQMFLFLPPKDIYKCLCLSKGIKTAAEDEVTWKILYYQLCVSRVDPHRVIGNKNILNLMNRPINEAAIGWRIEFYGRQGLVVDFRISDVKQAYKEEYLVTFDHAVNDEEDPDSVSDSAPNYGRQHNQSEWIAESGVYDSYSYDECYPSNSRIRFISHGVTCDGSSTYTRGNHNTCPSEEQTMREFFLSHDPPPTSWRLAHRDMMYDMPSQLLAKLTIHTDEVLDLSFNHSGSLLAAACRDGTFSLTQLSSPDPLTTRTHPTVTTTHSGPYTTHACNINFSPNDKYLTVVSNSPYYPSRTALEVFSIQELQLQHTTKGDTCNENEIYQETKSPLCESKKLLGYVCKDGKYVPTAHNDDLAPPPIYPEPEVRIKHAFRMPYNMSTPWLDDTRLVYTTGIRDAIDRNIVMLTCLDVASDYSVYCNISLVNSMQLVTTLRLAPGKSLERVCDQNPTASDTHTRPFEDRGLVFASNADGFPIGYPQILSVLPLSAFKPEPEVETHEYDLFPHIDTKGAILGIATNSSEQYHDVILVNLRPQIITDNSADLTRLPDISQDVEIRAYSAFNLQHLFTYKGHHGFTLKDCPFYIFVDEVRRYCFDENNSVNTNETTPQDQDNTNATTEKVGDSGSNASQNSLQRSLMASGSEDHKVYIWMGGRSAPVQILDEHSDHVGAVSFNSKVRGMLATASDDKTVCVFSSTAY
mmetsp:Transcript_28831/g.48656  ORF Transcript_28831/g.48656 Transcript_28831/m.48656 type:complete len:715 (+) Transcript_28831:188-2332(+)|eukprot:CAMPEP_0114412658 /NCGR_PEP_ID=MMETSP0103-20121206/443_1 /TAXON_ID=37642 ORGANISM="Paraphysomonas imperforata, Strain PA2" /NCGR_SAMPLE_ID=MMETSP0103 /ASSEMBLY_ACC=CAM_ASM_000201 /LENGTH=714 /DNA_ID=CAMNT_0001580689 /DNA_START=120 /DNA_END=2264 /DNA_ORIENTATION=+